MITHELLCSRVLLKEKKGTKKASDTDVRKGMESAPLANVSKGVVYLFNELLQ